MQPGNRLGPYEIVAPLGAGGMGEVWRARDSRLGRQVALKVLPEPLAADGDALERFEREARALAVLSHPHICVLHDVGHDDGKAFLVMELLAGETLASRLERGAMPLQEALAVAIQIADALAAAHRLGIVHRDLKPANVMLTRGSGVKLLDFGLAKRRASEAAREVTREVTRGGGGGRATRPSVTTPMLTAAGSLLGTLQYMAPEQLVGQEADARSDLFAFGAIVYEMVSGHRAFPGSSATSIAVAILQAQPRPLRELVPVSPPALDRLVRRCLEKEPEARWQSAADVAEALRWLADGGPASAASSADLASGVSSPARRPRLASRERFAWAAALAVAILALGGAALTLGWLGWRTRAPEAKPLHLSLPLPPTSTRSEWFQLAPDGRQLAWVGWSADGVSSLWVRRLGEWQERQLPGTAGAAQPFWSPDGRWLGFFADGKLKKVPVAGGPAQVLAPAAAPYGGAWSRRGVIVFAPGLADRLYKVSADGGAVSPLTKLEAQDEAHRWPCFLAQENDQVERFAFLADSARPEHHQIRLGSLAGEKPRLVVPAVGNPVCGDGHLLYVSAGTLLAQRLDVASGRLEGEPVALAEKVEENAPNHHFEVTAVPGLLAYRSVDPSMQFVWIDRRGRTLEEIGEPGSYGSFELSHDERRLAYTRLDADGRIEGVWWRDLGRGIASRVAASGERGIVGYPVWSPDAEQLALGVVNTGAWSPGLVRLGNPSPPRPLLRAAVDDLPTSWSPDGRWLAFVRSERPGGENDVWVASLADGSATRFTHDPGNEMHPAFSPDGSWIAYAADPSGRREVYVRRFPEGEPVMQVSRSGGGIPAWSGDGRELYYVSWGRELVVVPLMGMGPALTPGEPEVLFDLETGERPRVWWEGVAPSHDGSRFLALEHVQSPAREPLHVVVGWQPP